MTRGAWKISIAVALIAQIGRPAFAGPATTTSESSLIHRDRAVSTSSSNSTPANALEFSRVLQALGIVLALIFVLRWFGRRFFKTALRPGAGQVVQVLARTPLSPKQSLLLLKLGQRIILVGDCGSQMNPLCEISDPEEAAALLGQIAAPEETVGMFKRREHHSTENGDGAVGDAQPSISAAQAQINSLMDRVALVARQLKGT